MLPSFKPPYSVCPRRDAAVPLAVLGVEYVSRNPGTTELPPINALLEAPDMRYVLARQEAS
jgi:benzoylformate decarboxylase